MMCDIFTCKVSDKLKKNQHCYEKRFTYNMTNSYRFLAQAPYRICHNIVNFPFIYKLFSAELLYFILQFYYNSYNKMTNLNTQTSYYSALYCSDV